MEARKWGGGGGRTRPQHKGAWGAQKGQQEMKTEAQREASIEDTENRKELWELNLRCRLWEGPILCWPRIKHQLGHTHVQFMGLSPRDLRHQPHLDLSEVNLSEYNAWSWLSP